MRLNLAALVVVASSLTLAAQSIPPRVSLPRTEAREFTSKINGRSYRVYVSLPETYSQDNAARFPVVYLTDAVYAFPLTVQAHSGLRLGNDAPDVIFVGVAPVGPDDANSLLAARQFDLTPTRVLDWERDRAKAFGQEIRTGGAPEFLRVVREELIPDIDRRYRTTNDRTYIGYSLGGLFGAYTLFRSPATFNRMILVSPALWWDGGFIAKEEERFASEHKSLPVRLFMSDGEMENDLMLGTMRRLSTTLTGRHYQGLALFTRIFEGESHTTTFPVAVTRGLRTVFADNSKP
jgi:hypothetical protein